MLVARLDPKSIQERRTEKETAKSSVEKFCDNHSTLRVQHVRLSSKNLVAQDFAQTAVLKRQEFPNTTKHRANPNFGGPKRLVRVDRVEWESKGKERTTTTTTDKGICIYICFCLLNKPNKSACEFDPLRHYGKLQLVCF